MIVIFESILLLFYVRIADCCTQLPNNELVLVNKINETQSMNVQKLFVKQEQSQILLIANDSDINVQKNMYIHSHSNYSFDDIISVKCLRSYKDYAATNQYALLNKINDKYQIHTNSYQIENNQRLPEFNQYFEITDYICHDLEMMDRYTLVADCYNESSNVFIIKKEQSELQYFIQNQTRDQRIKTKMFAFKDDLLVRVFYYDEDYKQSSIHFLQIGETVSTSLIIDEDYINDILSDTQTEIQLQLVQVEFEQQIITILNKNQWVIQINAKDYPNILIKDYFQLDQEYPAIFITYHVKNQIFAFLTQQAIYILRDESLTSIKEIDNKNQSFQIFFAQNCVIQYNNGELSLLSLNLKTLQTIRINGNHRLIIDQKLDEIIAITESESQRIIVRVNELLQFKSDTLYQQFRSASLVQQINILESCTLNIRYTTIELSSTQAIPTVMNQFNTILNSPIESYEVNRFIDGPNITISNIIELKANQVSFSINFEILQQKTISGILNEQAVQYVKVMKLTTQYLYLIQTTNLYIQFYYCVQSMNCYFSSQVYFEFNLSSTQHEMFQNNYNVYIVIKNNEQLDIWKVQDPLIYLCTIYPDQDHYILQFQYINQFLAVLYSNQLVVLYKVMDQCQKSQSLTTEFIEKYNIEWYPSYISTNEEYNVLYVQTKMQLLLIQIKEKEIYPINIIPLSQNRSVSIFSYSNIIWIYYKDTAVIESFIINSITYIECLRTISLYNLIPNKFFHHQQSKYVYFKNTQDSLGTIYIYSMETSSHNALLTTFSTRYKILYSVQNLFIIADINNYYEIPQKIKYSIYYQDIENPDYLVKVNASLIISSYDNKEQLIYQINSTLVNPYTTITVNQTQLNLLEFLDQGRPIGYCESKYSWYTGQVVDIELNSRQLKLQKSMHLLNREICSTGIDIKEYVSDSVLILYQDRIIKLNMTNQFQQIFYLDSSITYTKIIQALQDFIFITAYKLVPSFSYLLQVVKCDQNFICSNQLIEISSYSDPRKVKIFQNLLFLIFDQFIKVYSIKDDKLSIIQSIDNSQIYYFKDVISPQQDYFQIYSQQDNKINITTYYFKENNLNLIEHYKIDLLSAIQQSGFNIDPKTQFHRIIIKNSKTQQQLLTVELFCQSYQHSHYILQIQFICSLQNNLYLCPINNYKVVQILQGYGTWPTSYVKMYNDQYLLMIYYQSTTFINALYNLHLNYVQPTISPTLFSGAIQYQNITQQLSAFFTKGSQIYLLTNSIHQDVFALYEIHNTFKFCIYDHLTPEKILITLKNHFYQKNETIEVIQNNDVIDNKTTKLIIWFVFGIILAFLLGILLFGCYIKYKKRQAENQLIL
ncbi:unnamed protein product (macronuclear) [Paramecium tetraurelia]|uniref:Transmembrane protein n=1 Tax=Paramecium tetraurelia TaxID=5888 RepID=A0DNP4_PARTE|nr:uncharacterized protein GSPATT00018857001 [Paramecium tetraurelia]CAK84661.1 unnamed protein product [Paramecium tetraurelia]|eukprot:XP_001452058.1 hypothetical protein (macronuclear) [Paramecium tetraurelia strain d4-2]